MSSDEIYREFIIDLYRNPLNKRENKNANFFKRGYNPICGDDLMVYLEVKDGIIQDCSYTGNACALAIASASIISEELKGQSVDYILELTEDKIYELIGLGKDLNRIKCVKLMINTINEMEI